MWTEFIKFRLKSNTVYQPTQDWNFEDKEVNFFSEQMTTSSSQGPCTTHIQTGRYSIHKEQHIMGWLTHLMTVYQLLWIFSTKWYEWTTPYGELQTARKEVVGVYFTVQYHWGTIRKRSKVCVLPRFKCSASPVQVRSVTSVLTIWMTAHTVTHLVGPLVAVHQLGVQGLPILCALLTQERSVPQVKRTRRCWEAAHCLLNISAIGNA